MDMRVLICDDAQFMRNIVKEKLTKVGYEIVGEASSGEEAVKKCKELNPDIVTMDVTMEGINGVEAVAEIKKNNPNIGVIMCSAMGQRWIVLDAIKAGAADFVVKPFSKGKLEESVKRLEVSIKERNIKNKNK